MKKLRVLVLMHEDLVPPEALDTPAQRETAEWRTEYDVVRTLRQMGHDVRPLGVRTDLGMIGKAIEEFRPHIAFNLLEEFHGVAVYDHYVVSYLELMRKPYTGCNPRGLMLAHDKALSKKILTYHRIPTPRFAVFPMNRSAARPGKLQFPMLVKSLTEEGSVGIAQASVVTSDQKLQERVAFIHEKVGTDAIAEEYIDGRELYVGIIGNGRLEVLPIWELLMTKLPEDALPIATARMKWDVKYQQRVGVVTKAAENLPGGLQDRIHRLCLRAYRILGLTGYARIDLRVTEDGRIYVIEANPNPQLAYGEDFADSAAHVKMSYRKLLQRIINLGLRYRAQWRQQE